MSEISHLDLAEAWLWLAPVLVSGTMATGQLEGIGPSVDADLPPHAPAAPGTASPEPSLWLGPLLTGPHRTHPGVAERPAAERLGGKHACFQQVV